ncbi:MAG: proton-conducting transporter membrane subunit [Zestosphaera sp.]
MSDISRYLLYTLSTILVLAGDLSPLRTKAVGAVLRVAGFMSLLMLLLNWYLDTPPSILFVVSVAIGSLITIYTPRYATVKYGETALQPLVDFFTLFITILFTSRYLMELVAFWLAVEILGFFVVTYDALRGVNLNAWPAGIRYLIVSMIPADLSLLLLLALTGLERSVTTPITALRLDLASPAVVTIAMLGFMAKAAVAPLHFWLPDAHSIAPSPGSAALSGLMVKMGIYGLVRLALMPSIDIVMAAAICLAFGSLTSIYGGLQALAQSDIKRILAYSTISHTSTMTILLGLYIFSGSESFLYAVIIYAVAHAIYKAALFMDSGVVEVLTHTRSIEKLGYVSRLAPGETLSAMISVLSLIGVPPTLGFLSKLAVFTSLASHITASWVYLTMTMVVVFEVALSIGYGVRYLLAHVGNPSYRHEEPEASALSLVPYVLTLSLLTIPFSYYLISCVGAVPLLGLSTQLILLLAFFTLVFGVAGWITYMMLKHGRRDEVWLGGARP